MQQTLPPLHFELILKKQQGQLNTNEKKTKQKKVRILENIFNGHAVYMWFVTGHDIYF